MIETTPKVHLSVYDYPDLTTIWTIVNNANIQHFICSNIMYLFHRTSITDKAWNAIKKHKHHWKNKSAEMDQHLFGTYTTLQKELRKQYSTSSEK